MKSTSLLLTILATSIFFFSCKREDQPLEKPLKIGRQLALPEGSFVRIDNANNTIHFKLAEGYVFIGENSKGELSRVYNEGTLTCKCSAPTKGGCSPFVANGPKGEITGCSMNNCISCTGTISASRTAATEEIKLEKLHIVDEGNPIKFITDLAIFDSLQSPTLKIMESDFVKTEVGRFSKTLQENNLSALKTIKDINKLNEIGYVLAPVDFYGYKIYVPVDQSKKLIVTNPIVNEVVAKLYNNEGEFSCKCNTTQSGCTLHQKNVLIGGAVWCEADQCASCSLIKK